MTVKPWNRLAWLGKVSKEPAWAANVWILFTITHLFCTLPLDNN